MSTNSEYASFQLKKTMGQQDFGEKFLDYVRTLMTESFAQVWNEDAVFVTQLTMLADGNDKIQISGTSKASDGVGHVLDIAEARESTDLQFENAGGVDYHVGFKHTEIPSGVQVNSRTGYPQYKGWIEEIGEKATPDAVIDNGNGTITLQVDSVTEPGVTCEGRKVMVYLVSPAKDASVDSVALETCDVFWSSNQNRITTVASLGQGAVSTTAADYVVVLLGPTIKRNVNLGSTAGYAYIGFVTGSGAGTPPTVFDHTGQEVADTTLSQFAHITRKEPFNNRLKIDVKPGVGESGINQIQSRDPAGAIKFWVDEQGNVNIGGDLTVQGETTQEDVVIVNSSQTITDNLTAGDDDATDSHLIKGGWKHTNNAETANHFVVDGATGRIGIGQAAPSAGTVLGVTGLARFSGNHFQMDWYDITGDIADGGLLRWELDAGQLILRSNTAAGGDFSTSSDWINVFPSFSNIGFGGNVIPLSASTLSLGSTGARWERLWLSSNPGDGIGSYLMPATNGDLYLGGTSYRWGYTYFSRLNVSAVAGEGVNSHLVPTTNGVVNLGNASYRWNDIYCDDIYTNGLRMPNLASGIGFVGDAFGPDGTATADLGKSTIPWGTLHARYISLVAGYGFASDVMPSADSTYDIGSSSFRWAEGNFDLTRSRSLSVSNSAGEGCYNMSPVADDSFELGNDSYRWNRIRAKTGSFDYISVETGAGEGLSGNLVPTTGGFGNIGLTSKKFLGGAFENFWVDHMEFSQANGDGWNSHCMPGTTATFDLGKASYRWGTLHIGAINSSGHIIPTANMTYALGGVSALWSNVRTGQIFATKMTPGYAAGDGFNVHVQPANDNSYNQGSATYTWNYIYCQRLYYDQSIHLFDNANDLDLIEKYEPIGMEKIKKGGKMRDVQVGDQSSLPWPMLGPKRPSTGNYMIDTGDAMMFLLGAIKELYKRHKSELGKFQNEMNELRELVGVDA